MNIQGLYLDEIVKNALMEDLGRGDVTTDSIFDDEKRARGVFIVKEEGIIAGIPVAQKVYKLIDDKVIFIPKAKESETVNAGQIIARVEGPAASILKGERTALNFMQRMSGIATKTRKFVNLIEGFKVRISDTRKTVPGLRLLDKYSVLAGGGYNHRFNLSDGVLIKDNHIKTAGSITRAVKMVKEKVPHTLKIEVEVENLEQLDEALKAGVDIILLDNMSTVDMGKAVEITRERALLEASGNINEDRLMKIAATGVDIISIGILTHSVKALDISLEFE